MAQTRRMWLDTLMARSRGTCYSSVKQQHFIKMESYSTYLRMARGKHTDPTASSSLSNGDSFGHSQGCPGVVLLFPTSKGCWKKPATPVKRNSCFPEYLVPCVTLYLLIALKYAVDWSQGLKRIVLFNISILLNKSEVSKYTVFEDGKLCGFEYIRKLQYYVHLDFF